MAARRVSLPSADELFRPTGEGNRAAPTEPAPAESTESVDAAEGRRPSGRVRHDEKMTVYITSEELLELEHARLTLRRDHGLAVDRGRLVRHAIAIALADLEANGDSCALVQRLADE